MAKAVGAFTGDDGVVTYYATYTGHGVLRS
jgi:hypothetical protein